MSERENLSIEMRERAVLATIARIDMDWNAIPHLKEGIITAAAKAGDLPVILVLTRVGFIASTGLSMLVELMQEFRHQTRRFILADVQPEVRNVLALTRLDKVFEICATVDEALARVDPESRQDAGSS